MMSFFQLDFSSRLFQVLLSVQVYNTSTSVKCPDLENDTLIYDLIGSEMTLSSKDGKIGYIA